MKIYKSYMFRMYPNDSQKVLIEKSFGCSRLIYNHYLDRKKKYYEMTKKSISAYDLIKELPLYTELNPFLKEIDSCILRCSIFNLDDAFKNFFNGSGYPKYKSKGIKESFRTNNIRNTYKDKTYNSIKVDLENKAITLPKLKEVKIRGYRNLKELPGRIINATVKKEAGYYYVSVLVEEELKDKPFTLTNTIGLDLGIKDTIITSDGYKIKLPNIERKLKRLKGLQKKLSRCEKNSNNRKKVILKIQKVYKYLKNMRKFFIHNVTNKIVKENDVISIETLDIKNMYKEKSIAKLLTNIPLYEIIEKLRYKTKFNNKVLIEIDKYFASTKICNTCGNKNKEINNLAIRSWKCPVCQNKHDRDINASINIMYEGIIKFYKNQLKSC